jgi:Kef-type K+ transport system membrane component KefB
MNPTAIEEHLKLVLPQWMVIIAAAWFFGRLARKLGQPLAVGEIFAGILLGPSIVGAIWPADWPVMFPRESQQSLQLLGKLGLILLLFQVGMEFDYGHLRKRSRAVTAVSICGIAGPFLSGLLIGPWLHREFAPDMPRLGFQMFLCIALSITALPIMGRILLELKLERTAIGVMGISAAAIDDVVGWILLALATALVSSGFDGWKLLGQVAGVVAFFFALQKLVGPWLRRVWVRGQEQQRDRSLSVSYLTLLLLVLFGSCLISNRLGVFAIFGAFLLGVALHQQTDLVAAWRNRFSDFVIVAMVPIFFTNTGLNTEIGSLKTVFAWLGCAVVLLAAVAGKLGGCFLGARLTGLGAREAGSVAALMNTRALMGLVAVNIGLDLKLLNRELFTMLVIMALLTTAMTEPLLRWWLPKELRATTAARES